MSTKIKARVILKKKHAVRRKPKSKAKFTMGKVISKSVRAPVAKSTVTHGSSFISYSAAPYHETVGAGLRLSGRIKLTSIVRSATTPRAGPFFMDNNGTVGTYVTAQCSHMISSNWVTIACRDMSTYARPMASSVFYNKYTADTNGNLTSTTCNALGMVARNYSLTNFRKVKIDYVPICATSTTGTIMLAPYFPEDRYDYSTTEISTYDKVMETPLWQKASLVVINDKDMSKPASRLYSTVTTDGNETCTTDKVDLTKVGGPIKQWAIIGYQSETSETTSQTTLGHIWMDFTVDLYNLAVEIQRPSLVLPITPTASSSSSSTADDKSKRFRERGELPVYIVEEKECKVKVDPYADYVSVAKSDSGGSTSSTTSTGFPSMSSPTVSKNLNLTRRSA